MGGSESPRAAPLCAVPCRAVPPLGGGGAGQRGIVPRNAYCTSCSESSGRQTRFECKEKRRQLCTAQRMGGPHSCKRSQALEMPFFFKPKTPF